ncbi:hypothetical protein IscW_ISCW002144 [Ixodes scapularis]|uniref:Uncharacterized protein n=1 Tax=Ixodes scapularis TaxID=6945 RepID=B7PAB3_IXOSC|nr:hypothetical protein IscW_ISCW002144 [Ixodes scapularis]|eukprot:XP_002406683.1 hypothetical protein IscW_ISCW002144 [Ixodes scapularis]
MAEKGTLLRCPTMHRSPSRDTVTRLTSVRICRKHCSQRDLLRTSAENSADVVQDLPFLAIAQQTTLQRV